MKALTGTHILVALTAAIVVAAVATGIVLIGPPGDERARRLDERRVRDLTTIANGVNSYSLTNTRLPASLAEVVGQLAGVDAYPRDPVSGEPYGYRPVDEKSYELCATFDRTAGPQFGDEAWAHGAGRRCFRRTPPMLRNAP